MQEAEAPVAPNPPAANPADASVTLEFVLDPAHLPALTRLRSLIRAAPSRPIRLVWHDDADQSLAAQGLSLCHDGRIWQLDRLEPSPAGDWPACAPPPPLARGADLAHFAPPIPFDVTPVSAFDGRVRAYRAGEVAATVLHGTLRGVVETQPACRLSLTGPAPALAALLPSLFTLGLAIPRATLAREALATARGQALPSRHAGAPELESGRPVGDGLAGILSHLLDALLFWTDAFRRERAPEAIHQARVATRRLRSALSIYKSVAACPELASLAAAAKLCAKTLGAARDWDVFLAGSGAALAAAAPGDARIALLLRNASRQREQAYTALSDTLADDGFRQFELGLGLAAALRPWEHEADQRAALQAPTAAFAAAVLSRRLKKVRHRGRGLDTLPIEALHELRKDCKRLRYAAEFFAAEFDAKRARSFLRSLGQVQDALGALNDTAAARTLLPQLGRAGRGYAGGMVEGMTASAAATVRSRVAKTWKRFKRADPFWK